jgi:hypothetical protein
MAARSETARRRTSASRDVSGRAVPHKAQLQQLVRLIGLIGDRGLTLFAPIDDRASVRQWA